MKNINIDTPKAADDKKYYQRKTTLRWFINSLTIFLPSVVLLLLPIMLFTKLPQGRDVIIGSIESITAENSWVNMFMYLLLLYYPIILWAFFTWYVNRIITNRRFKELLNPESLKTNKRQFPATITENIAVKNLLNSIARGLGYSCFTIMILIFWNNSEKAPELYLASKSAFYLIEVAYILISTFIFFILNKLYENKLTTNPSSVNSLKKRIKQIVILDFIFSLSGLILVPITATILLNTFSDNEPESGSLMKYIITILFLLFFGQITFLLFTINRRVKKQLLTPENIKIAPAEIKLLKKTSLPVKYKSIFFVLSGLLIIVSLSAVLFYNVAIILKPFSIVILALSFFTIVFNAVIYLTIRYKFYFFIPFIVGIFFLNNLSMYDSYHVKTISPSRTKDQAARESINTYFDKWLSSRKEKLVSIDSSIYPVFIIISRGGASRSALWTSEVLASLDDANPEFIDHVFCLSGASGGSVGNTAFLTALKYKENENVNGSTYQICKDYLTADFLSYPLAKMLLYDLIPRHLISGSLPGRDEGLESSMERGKYLGEYYKKPFLDIWENENLPALFINSTDIKGNPSVISNLMIDSNNYKGRKDILASLNETSTLPLSTSVVLGARFPYVSPAGRIDDVNNDINHYADGGYFDNAGAGVVFETLRAIMHAIAADTLNEVYYEKLRFFIIDIFNDNPPLYEEGYVSNRLNPFMNDLATPLLILQNSYKTQTDFSVNRLKDYVEYMNKYLDPCNANNLPSYYQICLTDPKTKMTRELEYSMSWFLSESQQVRMEQSLFKQLNSSEDSTIHSLCAVQKLLDTGNYMPTCSEKCTPSSKQLLRSKIVY